MTFTYYNEKDGFCVEWLTNLSRVGFISPGYVDGRRIEQVDPRSLLGFHQAHFFAGIGGWRLYFAALDLEHPAVRRLAARGLRGPRGQAAGGGERGHEPREPGLAGELGDADDARRQGQRRHGDLGAGALAPRPAAEAGRAGGLVHAGGDGAGQHAGELPGHEGQHGQRPALSDHAPVAPGPAGGRLADAVQPGRPEGWTSTRGGPLARGGRSGQLADADGGEPGDGGVQRGGEHLQRAQDAGAGFSARPSFWAGAEWVPCSDGKSRPVEPLAQPLAHGLPEGLGRLRPADGGQGAEEARRAALVGRVLTFEKVPNRVGRLRGYGNAIVPQVAAAFVRAVVEAVADALAEESP